MFEKKCKHMHFKSFHPSPTTFQPHNPSFYPLPILNHIVSRFPFLSNTLLACVQLAGTSSQVRDCGLSDNV